MMILLIKFIYMFKACIYIYGPKHCEGNQKSLIKCWSDIINNYNNTEECNLAGEKKKSINSVC